MNLSGSTVKYNADEINKRERIIPKISLEVSILLGLLREPTVQKLLI